VATRTSTQAGNWSDTATWGGSAAPGSSDTAVINHDMTVDVDTTVGTSGVAGTVAVTQASGVTVTVAAGKKLYVRGDYQAGGGTNGATVFKLEAGAGYYFDGSVSGAAYKFVLGGRHYANPGVKFLTVGTSGSRCTVTSLGTAKGYFSNGSWVESSAFDCAYTDFSYIYDPTNKRFINDGISMYNGGSETGRKFSFTNCTFSNYGQIRITAAINTNIIKFQYCNFSDYIDNANATDALYLYGTNTDSGGNHVFKDNAVDGKFQILRGRSFGTVSGCVFQRRVYNTYEDGIAVFDKNFSSMLFGNGTGLTDITNYDSGRVSSNVGITDNYFHHRDGSAVDVHGIQLGLGATGIINATGNIWENGASNISKYVNEGALLMVTGSGWTMNVKNNIVLKDAGTHGTGRLIASLPASGTYTFTMNVEHNTGAYVSGPLIKTGEGYAGHAGMFGTLLDNLVVGRGNTLRGVLADHANATKPAGILTPTIVKNNNIYNAYTGSNGTGYDEYNAADQVGGTDLHVDPQFVDATRKLKTWDAYLGGPGTDAHAIAELAKLNTADHDSDYTITNLLSWVKAGFKPTNIALKDAGYDGVTIGAMEWVSPDSVAPIISTLSATATGATTATLTVTTDEANGSIFFLLDGNATATQSAILAGLSQSVTASGVQTINISALTYNTEYYAHVLHRDAANNVSNILHSSAFRTADLSITLDFPDTAPCSLLGYQVWSKLTVTDEEIDLLWKDTGYPSALDLFYDAAIKEREELVSDGVHAFNSSITSPQYQLNSDGSYSNVGAQPAVDVIGGEKWLRSCGAVQNLLVSGVYPIQSGPLNVTQNGSYREVTKTDGAASRSLAAAISDTTNRLTYTITLRGGNGVDGSKFSLGFYIAAFQTVVATKISGPGTVSGTALVNITGLSTSEDTVVSLTLAAPMSATGYAYIYPCGSGSTEIGASVLIKDYILTATSYPQPYTPPGTTMPASNATTTNGVWFSLPQYLDAETADGLWKKDGVELVVNGGFDSDTEWSKDVGVTIGSGVCTFNNVAISGGVYKPSGAGSILTLGQSYICTYTIVSISAGSVRAQCGSGVGAVKTAPGTYTEVITASGGSLYFKVGSATAGTSAVVDNISLQKLIPATRTNPLWKALDGEPDGVEVGTFNKTGISTDGWWFGSCTGTVENGEFKVDSGANVVFAAYPELGRFPVVAGQRYVIEWEARSGTLTTLKYSVYDVTAGANIVSPTTYSPGKNRITVTAPAGCSNMRFYPIRDPGVAGTMYFDNISIQRIQPQPMTLATRVRMGVGSGDLPNGTSVSCLTPLTDPSVLQYARKSGDGASLYIAATSDISSYVYPTQTAWPRNSIVRRVTQVNAAGTHFRVGYMIEGTHSDIQWSHTGDSSTWVAFDGSFNPSTLYRLMLGYNNAYPQWYNKIAVFNKQASDAEILGALS
jgi:hypothetical protein